MMQFSKFNTFSVPQSTQRMIMVMRFFLRLVLGATTVSIFLQFKSCSFRNRNSDNAVKLSASNLKKNDSRTPSLQLSGPNVWIAFDRWTTWRTFLLFTTDGGVIAGGIIAAVLIFALVAGLLYYLLKVQGYKLNSLSLPTRASNHIDVVSYWLGGD